MQHEEMINERIDQLIAEYLSGSLTADAFQELKNWSQQSDENRMYVRNQIEVWFSSGVTAKDKVFDKEEAFARFQKRIGKKEPKVYRFSWKTFYRVAAVILIVLLPLAGYWKGQETLRQTFSDMVVEAPLGARTKLYLPDGTLKAFGVLQRVEMPKEEAAKQALQRVNDLLYRQTSISHSLFRFLERRGYKRGHLRHIERYS